ncbi:MAG: hypothetical protein ACHQXA_04000 [Gemmatimonadales bacterium]
MSTLDAINGVANACQAAPGVVTGGQPSAAHLSRLKAAGAAVILDIRDPMESRSFDEPATVRDLGLEYINIPVAAGGVDDALLERILAVVRQNKDRQIFFHCGSGNRVGGALIPYFMLDLGMTEEEAVTQAMRVGLRSPEMMEWGVEYARKHGMGEG